MKKLAAIQSVALAAMVVIATDVRAMFLNIQPVSVCIRAVPEPSCTDPAFDHAFVRNTWQQAGIDLLFQEPVFSEPFVIGKNNGQVDGNQLFSDFFLWRNNAGLAANTVYVGLGPKFEGGFLGLAATGYPFAVIGSEGFSPQTVAFTVAHEIGHALGADHDGDRNDAPISGFLMAEMKDPEASLTGGVPGLSDATRDAVAKSPLLGGDLEQPIATPAPFGVLSLATALAFLFSLFGRVGAGPLRSRAN